MKPSWMIHIEKIGEKRMVKIYLFLIIVAVLGGVGYGGYLYYVDTQEKLRIYAENQVKLEEAIKTSEATIQSMAANMARQAELNDQLNKRLNKATEQQDKLRRTLSKHNLTKDALTDPENLEKRMNNATEKVWARIESITGNANRSKLLEQKPSGEDSNKDGVPGKANPESVPAEANQPK